MDVAGTTKAIMMIAMVLILVIGGGQVSTYGAARRNTVEAAS